MIGETSLNVLLENLSPELDDQIYVFTTHKDQSYADSLKPKLAFEETEGTTVILKKEEAEAHGLEFHYPCRQITLKVESSLEAVGLIAHIATRLSDHGISVNPVSGFFHDHLFVPVDRAEEALGILRDLQIERS